MCDLKLVFIGGWGGGGGHHFIFHTIGVLCWQIGILFYFIFLNFQDTFDIRICLAKSTKFVIDFQTAEETDLHVIDIPLNFTVMQGGMIHGLAFWFEVGFLGSEWVDIYQLSSVF